MNGHELRRQKIIQSILDASVGLFNKYGDKKVTIEEIAQEAGVSKVTIYKYFSNKETILNKIVVSYFESALDSIEEVVSSDKSFLEKLQLITTAKSDSAIQLDGHFLEEIIQTNKDVKDYIETQYNVRVQALISDFYNQGKELGYIDKDVDNSILFLYMEIFKAGVAAKSEEIGKTIHSKEDFTKLINLYFFGLVKIAQ